MVGPVLHVHSARRVLAGWLAGWPAGSVIQLYHIDSQPCSQPVAMQCNAYRRQLSILPRTHPHRSLGQCARAPLGRDACVATQACTVARAPVGCAAVGKVAQEYKAACACVAPLARYAGVRPHSPIILPTTIRGQCTNSLQWPARNATANAVAHIRTLVVFYTNEVRACIVAHLS